MTGTRDRFGELIEPIEDDDNPVRPTPRTPDEIRAHCEELRAVLAESRARREADQ
jgi:hypothetical protein